MKYEKREQIDRIKNEANTPKDRLISMAYELQEIGAQREAQTLFTIIAKLEIWQNK